jgi:hypothetical protein
MQEMSLFLLYIYIKTKFCNSNYILLLEEEKNSKRKRSLGRNYIVNVRL